MLYIMSDYIVLNLSILDKGLTSWEKEYIRKVHRNLMKCKDELSNK